MKKKKVWTFLALSQTHYHLFEIPFTRPGERMLRWTFRGSTSGLIRWVNFFGQFHHSHHQDYDDQHQTMTMIISIKIGITFIIKIMITNIIRMIKIISIKIMIDIIIKVIMIITIRLGKICSQRIIINTKIIMMISIKTMMIIIIKWLWPMIITIRHLSQVEEDLLTEKLKIKIMMIIIIQIIKMISIKSWW